VEADAESLNGDETSVLFAGLFTVTPAIAGTVVRAASEEDKKSARVIFIGFLLGVFLAQSPSSLA
jgi:hypothetical protein